MCKQDAPDTSGMNAAAVANADIARETLAWYREKDAADKPMKEKLADKAYEVADQQLTSSKANDALAADYANYNKTTFRPLEQGIVADAQDYDTPEKRNAAATAAMADTNKAFAQTNDAAARRLAANGINPGSTRAMSVMQGQDVNQAVANAGAAFNARKGVETIGHARKMDAASLGRGLASSQATSAQVALSAGNNSVNNANAPLSASNAGAAAYAQGMNTVTNANQSAGNLYGSQANIQQAGGGGGGLDALGNVVGQFAGSAGGSALISKGITGLIGMSDENVKKDIEPVSDEEALAATNATPVKKWKYDPAKMAAEGVPIPADAAGENIGPMAQDVNRTMGDKAAPGGKELNLITMNGIAMKSIQALDKKVSKLAKMIEGGKIKAGVAA